MQQLGQSLFKLQCTKDIIQGTEKLNGQVLHSSRWYVYFRQFTRSMVRPIWSWFARSAKPSVEAVSEKRVVSEKWLRADSLHLRYISPFLCRESAHPISHGCYESFNLEQKEQIKYRYWWLSFLKSISPCCILFNKMCLWQQSARRRQPGLEIFLFALYLFARFLFLPVVVVVCIWSLSKLRLQREKKGFWTWLSILSPILHRTNSLFSSIYSAQLVWGLMVIWLPVGNIAAYSIYSYCPQTPNWLPPLFTILHDSLEPVTKSATVLHGLLLLLWKSVAKRVFMSRSVQDSVMRYSLISTVG